MVASSSFLNDCVTGVTASDRSDGFDPIQTEHGKREQGERCFHTRSSHIDWSPVSGKTSKIALIMSTDILLKGPHSKFEDHMPFSQTIGIAGPGNTNF